ncbi:MAG TPA: hypothetical protein VHK86_00055 [Nitrososphaera sp.]|jgi:hypothetical protein|nr:hypothetical protein [Nitrososphaera sp.]
MRRRIKNILQRMANGERFYSSGSPRITRAEYREASTLGFMIQGESCHGADLSEGYVYYALNKEAMKAKLEAGDANS